MGVTTLIHLILALPVVTLCSPDQLWLHQIYVDNKTGVDKPSCWKGGYSTPCLSLSLALTGAQHYNHSTALFLQPGQHRLRNESQLRNMSQLAIMGNGSQGEVAIRCEPLAGLAFFWSEVNMTNVSLVNCGAIQNSSSEYNSSLFTIQVAILFTSCKELRLTHVHVIESNGTGVVIYNSMGVVNIDKCKFSSNKITCEQETMYGGGGLMIEANKPTSKTVYTIMNSAFNHNNNTCMSGCFSFWPTINPSEYFGLSRGGGISMVFRGGAANNTVQLSSVYLDSNRAQFGGGLYLAFLGNTSSNTVSIDSIEVTGNEAMLETGSLLAPTSSGGGIFIGFEDDSSRFPFDNLITVSSSNFTSNIAKTGGGMTVDVLSNSIGCTTTGNKLVLEKCVFDENEAFQGASAYMSQSSKGSQTLLDTTVCCSNFTNGHCSITLTNGLPCSGNVVLVSYALTLHDYVIFADNNASALGLYSSSSVEVLPYSQINFTNNYGINGAALSIVDCSSLVVSNGVNMVFMNNVAYLRGGAIYAESCNLGKFGSEDCAIRHNNSALHPEKWNINVTFISNLASDELNSIYMNSIRFCTWPYPQNLSKYNFAFCWNGWHYLNVFGAEASCPNYIRTGPVYIKSKLPTDHEYTLYPGECVNIKDDFKVYDDYNYDITDDTNLEVKILSGTVLLMKGSDCNCHLPEYSCFHPQLDCFGPCDEHEVQFLPDLDTGISKKGSQILIHPPQLPGIPLFINFESCTNGTIPDSSHGCICEPSVYNAVCARHSLSACTTCFDLLPFITSDCSVFSNGNGLCGSCNDTGYGVAINSPNFICAQCQRYGAAVFVSQLILVLIMMIILAVLHINITNGNLNAYIMFSQIVTTQFPRLGYSAWVPNEAVLTPVTTFPLTVYSIWNLNFLTLFPEFFCIPHIDTAAGVIGIQYIIAVCPLLFIVVTYMWIRWYNNGYRFVVWITRPVHQLLARFWQRYKIQPSLIDTYAGLLLISFMCFLTTSVKLSYFIIIDVNSTLNTTHSIDVAEHDAVLGVTAVLCLLVFVIPLMVLLLFYHLKIFRQCLTWCKLDRPGLHALVDAYQGCFKNIATDGKERRYFAGLYLLFRFCYLGFVVLPFTLHTPLPLLQLVPFDTVSVSLLPLSVSEACLSFLMAGLVVILQPYKKTVHNVIDFLLLFLMTVIGASSFTYIGFVVGFYVLFLLVIVVFIYLIYHFLKCCCCCKRRSKAIVAQQYSQINGIDNCHLVPERRPFLKLTTTEVTLDDDYVPDDLYPDRMVNPGGYREHHNQYQPLEESISTT